MLKFNEKTCDKIFVGVYIVCFCVVSIYMMYTGNTNNKTIVEDELDKTPTSLPETSREEVGKLHSSYKISFWKILLKELVDNRTTCFQEENTSEKNPKPPEDNEMVVHISILLLQTSLIWTIVDFVDRYLKHGKQKAEKAPLHRTCSLADITLMRHQRRESMRKEYSLDLGHGRFPGRTFEVGTNLPRRCSLPVGPRELKSASTRKDSLDISSLLHRRMTINTTDVPTLEHKRSHMRLLHRH